MAQQALRHGCNPVHFNRLSRRGFLQLGVLAGTSLTLPQLLQAELKNYDNFEGTAKSIIHIFLPGGLAHQESFDPHPYAPIEYRGEMGTVKTKLDGVLFGIMDTRIWGTGLIYVAAVLTIWSMIYYLRRALPEIRAKAR